MAEVIWCADVEFVEAGGSGTGPLGRGDLYDVVEILDNGALRVSQVWQGSNQVGWCEVETWAAYFPPGSWKRVTPRRLAGTLFVEDKEVDGTVASVAGSVGPVVRLGARVSPTEAKRLAVDYLVQNYHLAQAQAEDSVREHFPTRGEITVTMPGSIYDEAGVERIIRFIFVDRAPKKEPEE